MHLRTVSSIPLRQDTYERHPKNALEAVSAQKAVNLLRQLDQVTAFASDIFASVYRDATASGARVADLRARVEGLDKATPTAEKALCTHTCLSAPALFWPSSP